MMKRALAATLGLAGLCLPLAAQEQFATTPLLDGPSIPSPRLSLEDRDAFFFSTAFGSMRAAENYLPAFHPSELQSFAYLPGTTTNRRRNPWDDGSELRSSDRLTFGGEFGAFYGKSSGKYGREDFSTYIIGTVGNDKFSITVGAMHQETTFTGGRWRR